MGRLDETKQEVLRATDIVSVVEQHVQLLKSGRSHKALCPFHQEKTPSFNVSAERQTWKCFGCGKGGNAIDFLMEKEGVDFKTALRALADRAGIRLPERTQGDRVAADARIDALEIQKLAAEFFRRCFLESKEGEKARTYVAGRGIDEEASDRFQIGYAPERWDALLRYLGNRGFSGAQAERAGVARQRKTGGAWFDRFRNRLMFPIHDVMGRVVGFGGRAFSDEDHPKYLNSDETPIFRKREVLYGLHLAKDAARARGEIAVVEGYTDAILAHQAGFPWFVATLGTAFGAEHAQQLKRIAPRLLVFFDGDAAGATANRRGLVEAAKHAIEKFTELRVALLPDGLDPADLIVEKGAAALEATVKGSVSLVDFFVSAAGKSTTDQVKAIEEICEILAGLQAETYREIEIAATAHRFHVDEELVRRRVRNFQDLAKNKSAAGPSHSGVTRGPRSASVSSGSPAAKMPVNQAPLDRNERWFLECLLSAPELHEEARAAGISHELCLDGRARVIAQAILGGLSIAEIEDDGARKLAADIVAGLDAQKPYAKEWPGVVALLQEERHEGRCTKDGSDELQESVARKLRRFEVQKRSMSVNSGERAGD